MTTTSPANCLALRTTEPMVAASLYAGIAARILDSTVVRRRTAGTGGDASFSMLLFVLHWEVEQGSLASLRAPHGGISAIRVLPTFSSKTGKQAFVIARFADISIESKPAFARGCLCDDHRFRSTKTGLDLCASARLYALAAHVGTPAGLGLRRNGTWGDWGTSRCHRNQSVRLRTLPGAASDSSCRCRSSASSSWARPWPRRASCA